MRFKECVIVAIKYVIVELLDWKELTLDEILHIIPLGDLEVAFFQQV